MSHTARTPELEKRLHLEVDIAAPELLGDVAEGIRMNYPILGGRFTLFTPSAEVICGTVVSGGYDCFLEQHDGTGRLDAIYSLKTDEGELINIRNRGWLMLTEQGQQQVKAGIWPIERTDYQCHCTPSFQVALGRLSWLGTAVLIGDVFYPSDHKVIITCYGLT
ncbi:DUF3237 domain-containing protein [Pokkaliibacter sp. MBI-7]|uniref:DUF3237 domain-containing protein n=1 Tax=Pokkaliibacter sp. MBI-7 TaxID=3040600 RepID=UPI0024499CD0|nr:DUF3237 domain-containing protein [Pokkaliibacter sp. MBI-7]MDH2435470.1 DUF3237 domain-containing protein [Pokkaliibacter sp. MBI-7]